MAAEEAGFAEIPLPFEHALVQYLQSLNCGFSYRFAWPFFHPRPDPTRFKWAVELDDMIEYPHSMDLADDLVDLCIAGVLSMKKASVVAFSRGDVAIEHKKAYLFYLKQEIGVEYETICEQVRAAFENPKRLLEECYKAYVRSTY